MVAGPDIGALVVTERIDGPFGQRKQRRSIHDGMVDDNLTTLHHPRQDFSAEGKAVSDVHAAVQVLLYVSVRLHGLVIDGREFGRLAEDEAVDTGRDDVKAVFQPLDERQEYLVGDTEARQQEQRRQAFIPENGEFHC